MNGPACQDCPLRANTLLFAPHADAEVALIQELKRKLIELGPGETVIAEGQCDAPLFTLFSGWAFRYKTLSDGRRQILNFLLPGDFIGVQQKMSDACAHGVETLGPALLCQFQRDALWDLHGKAPRLGFDVTWLAAHEESLVDEHLLSVGRRSAEERVAALLILLFKRAAALLPDRGASGIPFPLTQQHIADALGLSLVHTHRTLAKLARRGLHRIEGGRLSLPNPRALERLADLYGDGMPPQRPLI
jgi:CRP/FNR family transcriptional regulator, anaerobic regulatory protein